MGEGDERCRQDSVNFEGVLGALVLQRLREGAQVVQKVLNIAVKLSSELALQNYQTQCVKTRYKKSNVWAIGHTPKMECLEIK